MTSLGPYEANLDERLTPYSDKVGMHAILALVTSVNRTASKS